MRRVMVSYRVKPDRVRTRGSCVPCIPTVTDLAEVGSYNFFEGS